MFFNINLLFNGQCEEAFAHYEQVLGGENEVGTIYYKDVDPEADEDILNQVFYTELSFGDFVLRGQDEPKSGAFLERTNTIINLDFDSVTVGDLIYHDLSKEGMIIEPLSPLTDELMYAKFIDAYGITWEIYIHQLLND